MDKQSLKRRALAKYLGVSESSCKMYKVHPYDRDCTRLETDGFRTPVGCYIVDDSIEEAEYFHKCFIEDLIYEYHFFGALLNGIEDWAIDNCVNYNWISDKICDYYGLSSISEFDTDADFLDEGLDISSQSSAGELFRAFLEDYGGEREIRRAFNSWDELKLAFDYDKLSDYLINYQGWFNLSSDSEIIKLPHGFVAFWVDDEWFDSVILE